LLLVDPSIRRLAALASLSHQHPHAPASVEIVPPERDRARRRRRELGELADAPSATLHETVRAPRDAMERRERSRALDGIARGVRDDAVERVDRVRAVQRARRRTRRRR
jgi:hypothetical protein